MSTPSVVKKVNEATLKLLPKDDFSDRIQALQDSIARRAFEIFANNGRGFGRDLEDWLEAEREFLHPSHVELSESDGIFTVKAEVPGFTANDLEVSIEPGRLTIAGKRETKKANKKGKILPTDYCADQILRVVELPSQVDTGKVTATLKDGVLELSMPQAAPREEEKTEPRKA